MILSVSKLHIGLISRISLVRHGALYEWWDNGGWFEFRQTVEAEAVILGTSTHHWTIMGLSQSRPQSLSPRIFIQID